MKTEEMRSQAWEMLQLSQDNTDARDVMTGLLAHAIWMVGAEICERLDNQEARDIYRDEMNGMG